MMETITVRGIAVPAFLYGTAWKEERTEALTRQALEAGFRGIDTANQRKHYYEAGVGAAIAGRNRDELFLQTKFTYQRGQDHRLPYDPDAPIAEQVRQSFASSQEHLGCDVIDSLVLHGPWAASGWHANDRDAWAAMEALQRTGQVRLLGVSNISADQLRELVQSTGDAPAFVQNRCFARTGWDREVRALCRKHDIVYQGFSLLTANREELADSRIQDIATRHQRTVAQIAFRFARQVGMLPLTGSSSREHLEEDLAISDFTLSPDELQTIETIGRGSA